MHCNGSTGDGVRGIAVVAYPAETKGNSGRRGGAGRLACELQYVSQPRGQRKRISGECHGKREKEPQESKETRKHEAADGEILSRIAAQKIDRNGWRPEAASRFCFWHARRQAGPPSSPGTIAPVGRAWVVNAARGSKCGGSGGELGGGAGVFEVILGCDRQLSEW